MQEAALASKQQAGSAGAAPQAAAAEAAKPAQPMPAAAQQDDFGADELYGDIHDALPKAEGGAAAAGSTSQQQSQQRQQLAAVKSQPQPAAAQQPSKSAPPAALPLQHDGSGGGASSVVFVGNLQWWTTDAELEAACADFGPVSAVQFTEEKSNGRSKGYARVHFADATAAARCKAGLSGCGNSLGGDASARIALY